MSVDPIQEDLRAWHEAGDRRRGDRALDALYREWRPRVRRFLASPSPEEVEEWLHEAMEALCLPAPGQRPRALLVDDEGSPAAWRRTVLRNFLVDRSRRWGRRRHAEQALGEGLEPAEEKARWRARRGGPAAAADLGLTEPRPAPPPPPAGPPDLDLGLRRAEVLARLPALAVRRRVVLALALGADPSPWAEALARELGEPPEAVLARMEAARSDPAPPGEGLPDMAVRVCWPDPPLAKAREAARKALERAVEDLRRSVGGDA
ncbi:hypothetical protein L6R53_13790 [Myxococcota bacterium]|nr:hypothetical protein [Myxococcota bacterium]